MATRAKNNGSSAQSESKKQDRTTYPFAVNVTQGEGASEKRLFNFEFRTYGEGPIVGLKNGLKKVLEANPGDVDKSQLTAFGGVIKAESGVTIYASAIFADAQCPACGAPRNEKHSWCPACQGNVEADLEAEVAALADEF